MPKSKVPAFQFKVGSAKYHEAQAKLDVDLKPVHKLVLELKSFATLVRRLGDRSKARMTLKYIRTLVLSVEIAADLQCSGVELRKLVRSMGREFFHELA